VALSGWDYSKIEPLDTQDAAYLNCIFMPRQKRHIDKKPRPETEGFDMRAIHAFCHVLNEWCNHQPSHQRSGILERADNCSHPL